MTKKSYISIFALIFCLIHTTCQTESKQQNNSYRFSLPGDPLWPSYEELIELKSQINGNLSIRGETDYKPRTYNNRTNNPKPAAIAKIQNEKDVQICVKFAKIHKMRMAVISTGHHMDIRNTADNTLLLDMAQMNNFSIDLENKTYTCGPGLTYGKIHEKVYEASNGKLVAISGADGTVGPYGFSIGGGHGRLTRLYGLGADSLLNITMVLADGSVVQVSEDSHSDLFRALRGSGGQAYGVGISLTFKLFENPGKVFSYYGEYKLDQDIAEVFGSWMQKAPNYAGAYYLPRNYLQKRVTVLAYCFHSEREACQQVLNPLNQGCLKGEQQQGLCQIIEYENYFKYISSFETDNGPNTLYLSNAVFTADKLTQAIREINQFISSHNMFKYQFIECFGCAVLGGASEFMDPDGSKTSVTQSLRKSVMSAACYISYEKNVTSVQTSQHLIDIFQQFTEDVLEKYSTNKYVYWNEPQHIFQKNDWKSRYWGGLDAYDKLLEVKNKYDPENIFTCYHCVGWEENEHTDPVLCPNKNCSCSNNPTGECSNTDSLVPEIYIQYNQE